MTIVSVSLDDENLAALDYIAESLSLRGRSEAVRTAIKSATAELKELDSFGDIVEGVMVIVHENHSNQWVDMIQHKFEDVIKTQLHSHLKNRKCLELMIISGNGDRVGSMIREVHSVGEAKYIKFVRS